MIQQELNTLVGLIYLYKLVVSSDKMESEHWYLPEAAIQLLKLLPEYESWNQVAEARETFAEMKDDPQNDEQERKDAEKYLETINQIINIIQKEINGIEKEVKKCKAMKKNLNKISQLQNKLKKLKQVKQILVGKFNEPIPSPLPSPIQPIIPAQLWIKLSVAYLSQRYPFPKGEKISNIKRKLNVEQSYYCFSADKRQYKEQTLQQDISIEKCIVVKVHYKREEQENITEESCQKILPVSKSFKQLRSYLDLTPSLPQHAFISGLETNKGLKKLIKEEEKLFDYLVYQVKQIQLSYKIKLAINQIQLLVDSSDKIQYLKEKHESEIGINHAYQIWKMGDYQLQGNKSFEDYKFLDKQYRIKIQTKQIPANTDPDIEKTNQQLYFFGFTQNNPIQTKLFTQFYIEDDTQFQKNLQKNSPQKQKEFAFRNICLRIIFSSIKKHCLITSALKLIKSLASKTKFNQIWLSDIFNQNFILFYVLRNSKEDLSVKLMNIYKHYSPLPIKFYTEYNQAVDLKSNHFWIANKSMVIFSMGIDEAVKGKTTFLNQIFNLSLQQHKNRHLLCSKSVNIMYNIYGDDLFPVDLIDASSQSLDEAEKLFYCQTAEVVIIHHTKQNLEKAIKWAKTNLTQKRVIFVQCNNQKFQYKQQNNLWWIKIPPADQRIKQKHSNQVNNLIEKINKNIKKIFSTLQQARKWTFLNNLATNGKQRNIKITESESLSKSQIFMRSCLFILKQFDRQNRNIVGHFQKNKSLHPFIQKIVKQQFIKSVGFMKKLKEMSRIIKRNSGNKQGAFTFEGFWRQVTEALRSSQFQKKNRYQVNSLCALFTQQVASSETFQVIDGDNLKLQINLLKQKDIQLKSKNIKIIGILGLQSSGKSTLLNFLFGCNFMSSQGRCTNGIYGTYYDVGGKNIPNCDGVLILDTEGLFTNYKRSIKQGNNFDNKLVLFLIKICDIIIVNTRGDIDSKIQAILQLAFDNQLIDINQALPKMFISLNHGVEDEINSTQKKQISEMIGKIVKVCPKMHDLIKTEETETLPNAFITVNKKQAYCFQKVKKIPTITFYRKTKAFALKLMNELLTERSIKCTSRNLDEVYQKMDLIWKTIMSVQLLTKYENKLIKQFEKQIKERKGIMLQNIETFNNQATKVLCRNSWNFQSTQNEIKDQFKRLKQKNQQILNNILVEGQDQQKKRKKRQELEDQIKYLMQSSYRTMNLDLRVRNQKEKKQSSKHKGYEAIIKEARAIRGLLIDKGTVMTPQQIQSKFQTLWGNYTKQYQGSLERESNANEIWKLVRNHFQISQNKLNLSQFDQINSDDEKKMISNNKIDFKKFKQIEIKTMMSTKNFLEYKQSKPILNRGQGSNSLSLRYLNMLSFFQQKKHHLNLYLVNYKKSLKFSKDAFDQQIALKLSERKQIMHFLQLLEDFLSNLNIVLEKPKLEKQLCQKIVSTSYNILFYQKIKIFSISNVDKALDLLKTNGEINNEKLLICDEKKAQNLGQVLSRFKELLKKQSKYMNRHHTRKECLQFTLDKFVEKQCEIFMKQFYKKEGNDIINLIKGQISKIAQKELQRIGVKTLSKGQYSQAPIQIKEFNQLYTQIESLPKIFNKTAISKNISSFQQQDSMKIAVVLKSKYKVSVKDPENYLSTYMDGFLQQIIQMFRNANFKSFICQHINFLEIITHIEKAIDEEMDKKSSIRFTTVEIIKKIKKQLEQFNKDLSQISHQLTYHAKYNFYKLGMAFIWKKFQEQKERENIAKRQQLQKQKRQQYEIFLSIIQSKIDKICKNEAKETIKNYLQHLKKQSRKTKSSLLNKQLVKQQNIRGLKLKIQKGLLNKQPAEILLYVQDPKKYIQSYYQNYCKQNYEKCTQNYESPYLSDFNQFYKVVEQLISNLQNKNIDWTADSVINEKGPFAQQILWRIFLQLIIEGKTISNKSLKPDFKKIKNNYEFITKVSFQSDTNKKYFSSLTSKQLSITNFLYFLKFLHIQMKSSQSNFKNQLNFTKHDENSFYQSARLQICDANCPCCGMVCDVDIKKLGYNHIHECSSGHLPRALKGIRIKTKSNIYASIFTCQDVPNGSTFQFDGQLQIWMIYKEKEKKWNFQANPTAEEKKLIEELWKKGGNQICLWRTAIDGQVMKYIQKLEDIQIDFFQNLADYHYVFAIDGSGSMSGTPWSIQLQQLRTIMCDLAKNQQNNISVVVFNQKYQTVYDNTPVSSVDVRTIQYPSGGTSFQSALGGAVKCLNRDVGKRNLHFVMITDGLSSYPSINILQMKKIKVGSINSGFKFAATLISIGSDQAGKTVLTQIVNQLGGSQAWINNTSQISEKFREVMKSKYK